MSEGSEAGSAVAWRLLATLEGGSALVAAAALLAHLARPRRRRTRSRDETPLHSVLISNASTPLGKELAVQLQSRGCRVVTSGASGGASSGAGGQVDALIVVGAQPKAEDLEGLTEFVSEDVYAHLKSLETLSRCVRPGGRLVWAACTGGAASGAFSGAAAAFDDLLRTQLDLIANTNMAAKVSGYVWRWLKIVS